VKEGRKQRRGEEEEERDDKEVWEIRQMRWL
jgi:hypothetical protein